MAHADEYREPGLPVRVVFRQLGDTGVSCAIRPLLKVNG